MEPGQLNSKFRQPRIALPFAAGTLCMRAIEQLHLIFVGSFKACTPLIFHRAKAEIQSNGCGRLIFLQESKIDLSWKCFPDAEQAWPVVRRLRRGGGDVAPYSFNLNGVQVESNNLSREHLVGLLNRGRVSEKKMQQFNLDASTAQQSLSRKASQKQESASSSSQLEDSEELRLAQNLIALQTPQ